LERAEGARQRRREAPRLNEADERATAAYLEGKAAVASAQLFEVGELSGGEQPPGGRRVRVSLKTEDPVKM
jgi:hypothetical protein